MRRWSLLVALFIFVFPSGLYLFFRGFGQNTYELPVYLTDNPTKQTGDCTYVVPYNLCTAQPSWCADSTAAYLISAQPSKRLDSLIQYTQQILQKQQRQTFSPTRIVMQDSCSVPLRALFKQHIPDEWVVVADKQGQIRSFFTLKSEKEFQRAQHELYLLATTP